MSLYRRRAREPHRGVLHFTLRYRFGVAHHVYIIGDDAPNSSAAESVTSRAIGFFCTMTTESTETSDDGGDLSEEQRASVFAAANASKSRSVALRARQVAVPRKFVLWSITAVLVLGLGGEVAQHFFETYGKAPKATVPTSPVIKGTPPSTIHSPTLISLQVFMGLKDIGTAVAPTFTLTNQSGHTWSLKSAKGKVVVLAFYNAICNDICPVLGTEIKKASAELGTDASKVVFVIVNTDPNHTHISPESPAIRVPGLTDVPSLELLSGHVSALNAVWSHYGVRILVGHKSTQVSHNNVLYFISPQGNLAAYASPFGTENKVGLYSLGASSVNLYARAIAETADSLVQ
jgi:cytochrome oxidase Cu insertion factor (SCO1/SenC/PrrC family)